MSAVATDQGPLTVVGVAPEGFRFPREADVWHSGPQWVLEQFTSNLLVRVSSGEGLVSLNHRLDALAVSGAGGFQEQRQDLTPWAESVHEGLVSDAREPLLLLLAAAGFVLLLAAVNVANLLLARGLSRRSEWALRSALGASRARIVRQVVLESVLLSLAGGLAGILLVWATFAPLLALIPAQLPRVAEITLDTRVFLVMMSIATAGGVLAGLFPALKAAGVDPARGISSSSRGATPGSGHRLQSVLMSAEVALGTVLVVGATVLMLTLQNLFAVDPGFRTDVLTVRAMNVGFARLRAGEAGYDPLMDWEAILAEVRSLPGVQSAGSAAMHPMERGFEVNVDIVGSEGRDRQPTTMFYPVSDGYVETVGIALVAGRDILRSDDESARGVALVNREFVRRYIGEGDPIGTQVRKSAVGGPWGNDPIVEIVGVVENVKNQGLGSDTEPVMFVPLHQSRFGYLRLFMRSEGDPFALKAAIQEIIWDVDSTVPLADFEMLSDAVRDSAAQEIFLTRLLGVFAVIGLGLAVGGVYGVVSFAVGRRTREIGIRRAIGGTPAPSSISSPVGVWHGSRWALR